MQYEIGREAERKGNAHPSLREQTSLWPEPLLSLKNPIGIVCKNVQDPLGVLKAIRGLPWWHSGQESACQCRGQGFDPWAWKISHAAEQLNPCATTTEPAL